MDDLVMGVDSSTQSCKVEIRSADSLKLVASGSAPHPPAQPPASQQAPTAWWTALRQAINEAGQWVPLDAVRSMSVAAQCHGLVVLDSDHHPLGPSWIWNNTTAGPEASELRERLGAHEWTQRIGSPLTAAFLLPKLLRRLREDPSLLGSIAGICNPHDWLTYRLTGEFATDRSDASGSGYFDPATSRWDPELLSLVLDSVDVPAVLPRVAGPDEVVGTLQPGVADELGLSPDVLVGVGAGDQFASALGLGLASNDVAIGLGTSGVVFSRHPLPIHDEAGLANGMADAAGEFLPIVVTMNATKVTDWTALLLGVTAEHLVELALDPVDPERVPVLVPYLDGERAPNRPDASGLIGGLRTDTTRNEIAAAAHAGVLSGLLFGLDHLTSLGIDTSGRLVLTGGGARSSAYQQLLASLAACNISLLDADESVARGACVQAAAILRQDRVADVAERFRPDVVAEVTPNDDLWPNYRVRFNELSMVDLDGRL